MGLSPRVRGNLSRARKARKTRRSIPACARGTVSGNVAGDALEGLSPRVRGNRRDIQVEASMLGSIPACAGEPPLPAHWPPSQRVYPRVCGGTSAILRCCGAVEGLSPRVRGNHRPAGGQGGPGRSIPACAGEP